MQNFNIEIKARCPDLKRIRGILHSLNADFKGADHQIDTYFHVPNGRLKIREGNIESALIQYQRDDQKEANKSEYRLFKSDNLPALKETLSATLVIKAIVDKKREIYFIRNAKIHLDEVKDLGTFLEIEIVNMGGNNDPCFSSLENQCEHYINAFGIRRKDLIEYSYSDLILKTN